MQVTAGVIGKSATQQKEKENKNMKRESKTLKEIFREKYNPKEVSKNPLLCCEAIGYLKALNQFLPNEEWLQEELEILLICLLLYIK